MLVFHRLMLASAIPILMLVTGCSSGMESPTDPTNAKSDGAVAVTKPIDKATPILLAYNPSTGTLSDDFLSLRFDDVVHVAILGDGKTNLATVRHPRLAGAAPIRRSGRLLLDDTDGSETVQIRDVNGDGNADAVYAFAAKDMAPPSDANRFFVEISGSMAITIWDYERLAWPSSYWPTLSCATRPVDHLVFIDLATGTTYPSSVELQSGDVLGVVINDYTRSHGCDVDLHAASLFFIPEIGDEFYEKGNQAAGLRQMKRHDHFMDYSDDICFGQMLHFDLSPLHTGGGKGDNGFLRFSVGKTQYEFFTNYRPLPLAGILVNFGSMHVK